MNQQPADVTRVRQVELWISTLLRTGVIVSLILICVGLAVSIIRHHTEMSDPAWRHDLIEPTGGSAHTLTEVARGLKAGQGRAIITLGLLVLIATPVLRVAASIIGFVYERDRIFVLITSVVLALLILSFVLGRAGG